MNYAFANTFRLKVKKGSNTFVLGNGNKVPTIGHIKVHVKIQQYQSQTYCLFSKLTNSIDMTSCNYRIT